MKQSRTCKLFPVRHAPATAVVQGDCMHTTKIVYDECIVCDGVGAGLVPSMAKLEPQAKGLQPSGFPIGPSPSLFKRLVFLLCATIKIYHLYTVCGPLHVPRQHACSTYLGENLTHATAVFILASIAQSALRARRPFAERRETRILEQIRFSQMQNNGHTHVISEHWVRAVYCAWGHVGWNRNRTCVFVCFASQFRFSPEI